MSKEPKKMTDEQVAEIKKLHASGKTAYAIAKLMSIPQGVARYHINRQKLSSLNTPSPKSSVLNTPTAKAIKDKIAQLDQKKTLLQELLTEMGNK